MNTSSHQEIIKEIVRTTAMIYKQFPELYENLSETPLHGHCDMNDMYKEEFSGYLESLTTQWSSYCKVHQIRRFTSDANYLKHYIHLISSNATASSLP